MAKIIDFKTRQVLADFPKDVCSVRASMYRNPGLGNGTKFYIISYSIQQATKILDRTKVLLQLDQATQDQSKVG